jgi:hypothetical protein
VTKWPEYDAPLVRRGYFADWFIDEAVAARSTATSPSKLGWYFTWFCQTEGALRSIATLLGVRIRIPDHTTLRRRSGDLRTLPNGSCARSRCMSWSTAPGVTIYGKSEWLDYKHGVRSARRWRKLHAVVAADTHEIGAVEWTADDVGDASMIPDLLD